MFAHVGTKALWPTIFFLPWLSVGIAYLFQWLRHRDRRLTSSIRPSAGRLRIIGLGLLLIGAPLARADPVLEEQQACLGSGQHHRQSRREGPGEGSPFDGKSKPKRNRLARPRGQDAPVL